MNDAPEQLRLELGRKAIHLSMIVIPVWIFVAPEPLRIRGLLLAFLMVLVVDVARLAWRGFGDLVESRVGAYLRVHERQRLTSVHYLTFAAIVVTLATPRAVATAAMSYLVLGDAAAALVGRFAARSPDAGKTLAGSLGCFVTCLVVGWLLLPGQAVAVFAGAFVATLVERVPSRIDDNLSVPLASAAVLSLLVAP